MQSVPITNNVVNSNPVNGEVCFIQHYVIKFVREFGQVSGFLKVLFVSSTNKTDCHDITTILLKVALNTITIAIKTENDIYQVYILLSI